MKLPTSKRIQSIMEQLEQQGFVKAHELSQQYEVSMETIRKDLNYLEEAGVAHKEYGGASLALGNVEKTLAFRQHDDAKKEIARYVMGLLQDHHSLLLDAGTTCQACVKYINLLPSMDIVTNSFHSFAQLNGNLHNVFLTPGKKREKNGSLLGNWTEHYLQSIHVDICFLGTSGLLDSTGPTSHSYQELSTKQRMIQQSDLVFVLADSSKFHERGLHTICDWNQIDGIITDSLCSPKLYESYQKKVPVYVAKEEKL